MRIHGVVWVLGYGAGEAGKQATFCPHRPAACCHASLSQDSKSTPPHLSVTKTMTAIQGCSDSAM